MSARLPIARAILDGESCFWSKLGSDDEDRPADPELQRRVKWDLQQSIPFDIQVGSDLYLSGGPREYRLESSFGALRLPYPRMWMEWQVADEFGSVQTGVVATESETPEGNFKIHIIPLLRIPSMFRGVNVMRVSTLIEVLPSGEYVAGSRQSQIVNDGDLDEDSILARSARIRSGVMDEILTTTGLALNLINCKNVTTQESGRINIRRSGAEKRRGEAAKVLRYHTIMLPGGGSVQHGSGPSATHRAAAIHRVRGHFKTFTADAPLMGKHVGTYWWGWQIRGNKDSGMVVSDYKVGAAS